MKTWNRKRVLWLLVLAQVLFLFGLAGSYYAIDVLGEVVVLEIDPVDPRDLFYGDYVFLNNEVSRLPRALLREENRTDERSYLYNRPIYVQLEHKTDDEVYEATRAYLDKSKVPPDALILRGQ